MPRRIVPQTPLRRYYKSLGKVKGNLRSIQRTCGRGGWKTGSLEPRYGVAEAGFLAELFARSLDAMSRYDNQEHFYGRRKTSGELNRISANARTLITRLQNANVAYDHGVPRYEYLDREICPTRTTKSCTESGQPATDSGSGGIDVLLLAEGGSVAVGEVKAITDAGPTYALIQALCYAAELATEFQWRRLVRHYPAISENTPTLELVILLEHGPDPRRAEDLTFAGTLAGELMAKPEVATSIAGIRFLSWRLQDESASISQCLYHGRR